MGWLFSHAKDTFAFLTSAVLTYNAKRVYTPIYSRSYFFCKIREAMNYNSFTCLWYKRALRKVCVQKEGGA